MEALLACFLSHTRGRFLLEAIGQPLPPPPPSASAPSPAKASSSSGGKRSSQEPDDEEKEEAGAASSSGGAKSSTPPAHGLRETESFDVKLLALNALTNCVERGDGARARVGGLAVALEGAGARALSSSSSSPLVVVPAAAAAGGGGGGGAGGKKRRGAEPAAEETTTPMVRFLAQYLLLRVRPFRAQLAKALIDPEAAGQGRGQGGGRKEEVVVIDDSSDEASASASAGAAPPPPQDEEGPAGEELLGDEQAEQLVLAGYTSLLLGCLMRAHPANRAEALAALPGGAPTLLVRVLKAFLAFQQQVGGRV